MRIKSITLLLLLIMGVIFSKAQQKTANITDPELSLNLPDAKGDLVSLASLKGKVVLLDFWASWCMPCRMANKKLVKIYDKYKSRDFEIYSVSVDDNKKDWIKAIEKDKISWVQVIDPRNQGARSAMKWNISVLPTTFLVNKLGNVVAIDPPEKKLDAVIGELLAE